MSASVSIIVAVTRDGAIGRGGDLVYRLRGDMRHFRTITMGHPVVMGRKTWESLPNGALPGRRNMVVSRDRAYEAPGAEVFPTLEAAIAAAGGQEVMIIGGAQIYEAAMPLAERLYLTEIDAEAPDADTFFPAIHANEWERTEESEWQSDTEDGVRYRFVCLSRK